MTTTSEFHILDRRPGGGLPTVADTPRPRRFYVETWGCQMNELDSQRMSAQLMQQGILPTPEVGDADVILLNSCSVREKAAQKAYSRLGEYRLLKRQRPHLMIGFCGCVAQQEGESAVSRVPDLDFVVGPGRVGELAEILERRRSTGKPVVATGFPDASVRNYDLDSLAREGTYKGMVTIIEGCNKKCTFCIVPSTRGPEQSRPLRDVLSEVEHLLDLGFVEIELLGQTVNHWVCPETGVDFAVLLDRVARLGMKRLRFVTSYPRDFSQPMVDQFARHENLSPYLHLPVQSASNRMLKLMGRGYEIDLYDRLIASLRLARPGIALSSDFIIGFPGETEEDHRATLDLIERVRYAQVFAFKYSPRPGTAAPRLKLDAVPDDVADRRLQEVFAVQGEIQRELNRELEGSEHEVLVTQWGRKPGTQTGRTACHRLIHFEYGAQPIPLGSLTRVRVAKGLPHSLLGELTERVA
ncbi:MAG: tRNA (N6-isopentenyl adenosine(37)-C2)-methylthiotransferase MiaB [Acidobacteriota bacterium]